MARQKNVIKKNSSKANETESVTPKLKGRKNSKVNVLQEKEANVLQTDKKKKQTIEKFASKHGSSKNLKLKKQLSDPTKQQKSQKQKGKKRKKEKKVKKIKQNVLKRMQNLHDNHLFRLLSMT